MLQGKTGPANPRRYWCTLKDRLQVGVVILITQGGIPPSGSFEADSRVGKLSPQTHGGTGTESKARFRKSVLVFGAT